MECSHCVAVVVAGVGGRAVAGSPRSLVGSPRSLAPAALVLPCIVLLSLFGRVRESWHRRMTQVGVELPVIPGLSGEVADIAVAGAAPTGPAVLIMTTDAGSDMSAGAGRLDDLLCEAGTGRWACIRQHCVQHQLHLVVMKQISRSAERTWPLLAMLCHLWRHHSVKFASALQLELGYDMPRALGRPPPQPIRGRWGSSHLAEERVLKHGREVLLDVSEAQKPRHVCHTPFPPAGPCEPRSVPAQCGKASSV